MQHFDLPIRDDSRRSGLAQMPLEPLAFACWLVLSAVVVAVDGPLAAPVLLFGLTVLLSLVGVRANNSLVSALTTMAAAAMYAFFIFGPTPQPVSTGPASMSEVT